MKNILRELFIFFLIFCCVTIAVLGLSLIFNLNDDASNLEKFKTIIKKIFGIVLIYYSYVIFKKYIRW